MYRQGNLTSNSSITSVTAHQIGCSSAIDLSSRLRSRLALAFSLILATLPSLTVALAVIATCTVPLHAAPSPLWDCQPRTNGNNDEPWRCQPRATTTKATPPIATQNTVTATPENTRTPIAAPQKTKPQRDSEDPHTNLPVTNAADLAAQDWQTIDDDGICGGRYINPITAQIDAGTIDPAALDTLPIVASAETSTMEQTAVVLEDNVLISRGTLQVQSDWARIDRENELAALEGNVVLRTDGGAFGGNRADIDMQNNTASIEDANYVIHAQHSRGTAARIASDGKQTATIDKGTYTSCAPGSRLWQIRASRIALDRAKGSGTARHARLELGGVPVAYLPWAVFPLSDQRQSGFLFPSLSDSDGGFDVTLPWYWNIAPNADATLAPRYNAERGYITEAELRWLNRFERWTLSGAYVDDDRQYAREFAIDNRAKRWVVGAEERGNWAEHITTAIDYTRVSDDRYLRDLNTTSLSIRRTTHLSQRAQLQYLDNRWTLGANIHQYQTIDPASAKPFEQRPEVWLGYRSLPKPFQPGLDLNMRYTDFSHDDRSDGQRGTGALHLDYPMQWAAGYLTPRVGVNHLQYRLNDKPGDPLSGSNTPELTVPEASLAMGLHFERRNRSDNRITQRLEPGIFYLYREQEEQDSFPVFDSDELTLGTAQLTRTSRFSGYDRLEGLNQVALSLTHSALDARGAERLRSTVGQVFYFDKANALAADSSRLARDSSPSSSHILADLNARWTPAWHSLANILWDTQRDRVDQGRVSIAWRQQRGNTSRQSDNIANLSYHFRRSDTALSVLQRDIELADFSVVSALGKNWRMLGRYQYDVTRKDQSEALAGIEYQNCCLTLRMVYREGLVYQQDPSDDLRDRSLFLQIQLKGLFGVGEGLETTLQENIFGYGDRTRHYRDLGSNSTLPPIFIQPHDQTHDGTRNPLTSF